VLDSYRAHEDTDSLRILIKDSLYIFCEPEGVLLEPDFKVVVEDSDEGAWLLAWTLADS